MKSCVVPHFRVTLGLLRLVLLKSGCQAVVAYVALELL